MIIVEATSGNTGIGLTLAGIQKGYEVVCVMPENMSDERKKIIRAFGGRCVFTGSQDSLPGCLKKLKEIVEAAPEKYFIANQFGNPHNPEVHYLKTAREIWDDLNGEVDVFLAGVGSGGTLQGVGKFLKEKRPKVKVVAVEPKNAPPCWATSPGCTRSRASATASSRRYWTSAWSIWSSRCPIRRPSRPRAACPRKKGFW